MRSHLNNALDIEKDWVSLATSLQDHLTHAVIIFHKVMKQFTVHL